jgi:ATP-binding cassette subfamily B protein
VRIQLNQMLREVKKHRPGSVFRYFKPYLKGQKGLLVLGLLSAMAQSAFILAQPWPLKIIFDYVLIRRPLPKSGLLARLFGSASPETILGASIAAFIVITLLDGVFNYRYTILVSTAGHRIVLNIRRKLFAHVQRLSLQFHDQKPIGELVTNIINDINMLREMLVDSMMTSVSQSLVLVGMPFVMLAVDPLLTLVSLVVLPALALVAFHFSGNIRQASRKARAHEGRIAATASEALRAIHVIQAFARADYHDHRFADQNNRNMKFSLRSKRLEANMTRTVDLIVAVGICGVLGLGAYRAKLGVISPGDLLVFMTYLRGFYRPLRRLAQVTARMSKVAACSERVMEILSVKEAIQNRPNAFAPDRLRGEIQFSGASFRYSEGRPAVKDLSFVVEPGKLIGIVGPSGAGKSTLLNLLLRIYDPKKGQILVDGRDIRDYDVEAYRERFGVVLPEPILFNTTIAENIAYGRPGATPEEIEEAAKSAHAHEFILGLPNGYQTEISETGTTLSSGQQQRIALARALVKDFDILLVDEPFARLDAVSIEEIKQALFRLRRKCTTFFVTHDLHDLVEADRIFVLTRGGLVAQGTHAELLESCAWFRRVHNLQKGRRRITDPMQEPHV